jgi:hypothetical protein
VTPAETSATVLFARVPGPAIRQAEGSAVDRQPHPSPPQHHARSDYAHIPVDQTPNAVMRQALRVSVPTDPAEREAEQVSARIMAMRLPDGGGGPIRTYGSGTAARAPSTGAPAAGPAPAPAARPHAAQVAAPDVTEEIRALAGKGQKLPASVITFMAPRFKADFSQVTIDTSPRAARLAARLQARAFTFERTIFFGHDQFKPDTEEGRALIAHELTHTIQQRAVVQRQLDATVAMRTAPAIQRWGMSDVLAKFGDLANALPGFRLMTIVLGVNPITMEAVPRDAANLLRAVIEIMPGGILITQALDHYGVIARAASWLQTQFASLGVSAGSIKAAIGQFIDSLGLSDALHLGDLWDRAKRIVMEPIARIGTFIGGLVEGLVTMVRDAILVPLAARAAESRGWTLLTAVLGRNPITGEAVPRNAETLIGGFMTLIGQEDVWQNIKQGNAVARCWAWFQTTLVELEGFVGRIPDLFLAALHALGIADLLTPVQAFLRVAGVFGAFAGQFIAWGGEKVWNLLEIVFDVVKPGALGYVKRTGAALKAILKNPMPFVGNLVRAAKLGFTNFAGNIGRHLKTGLIDWLTGSLTGVYIPQAMTLVELGRFALSVLGLTWSHIRGKIVKALGPQGETMMKSLETGFDIVVALVKGGLSAAWALIAAQLASLRDMVLDGIIGFVTDTIIGKAIPKLISMFIPGAGFISAILSIYDTVMVFVEKLSKIAAAVAVFVDSIIAIAAGQVDAAANKVESTLAGLLSLAISFLAGFIGLGNVAEKVMTVVKKVYDTIDKAFDTAIGFVLGKAKAFLAKLFHKSDGKTEPAASVPAASVKGGAPSIDPIAQVKRSLAQRSKELKGADEFRAMIKTIAAQTPGLTGIYVTKQAEGRYAIEASASPKTFVDFVNQFVTDDMSSVAARFAFDDQVVLDEPVWNNYHAEHAEKKIDLQIRKLLNEARAAARPLPKKIEIYVSQSPCKDKCNIVLTKLKDAYPEVTSWSVYYNLVYIGKDANHYEGSLKSIELLKTKGFHVMQFDEALAMEEKGPSAGR